MDRLFGYRLRECRTDNNLTGKELAEKIGASKGTIAHWEAGDYYPNNEKMILLADVLGVSIDYLMGRTKCKIPISVLTAEGDRVVDLAEFTEEQQELIKSLVRQFKK